MYGQSFLLVLLTEFLSMHMTQLDKYLKLTVRCVAAIL
jgi:hypothetical protein